MGTIFVGSVSDAPVPAADSFDVGKVSATGGSYFLSRPLLVGEAVLLVRFDNRGV